MKDIEKDRRVIQLVAREGMICDLLDTYNFPTENHRKILEFIWQETVDELTKLGAKTV